MGTMQPEILIAAYNDGASLRALSRKSGLSLQACKEILEEHGVEIRSRGRIPGRRDGFKLTDDNLESIAKLYEKGQTMQELGDEFGVSKQRVHQILTDMGVEIRRRGPRSKSDSK